MCIYVCMCVSMCVHSKWKRVKYYHIPAPLTHICQLSLLSYVGARETHLSSAYGPPPIDQYWPLTSMSLRAPPAQSWRDYVSVPISRAKCVCIGIQKTIIHAEAFGTHCMNDWEMYEQAGSDSSEVSVICHIQVAFENRLIIVLDITYSPQSCASRGCQNTILRVSSKLD